MFIASNDMNQVLRNRCDRLEAELSAIKNGTSKL